MPSISQILRDTRMRRGISLEEVAQKTYIKLPYLTALEEGRLDCLPAPVYISGYIRQYAKLLGLDGNEMVRMYQEELNRTDVRPFAPPQNYLRQEEHPREQAQQLLNSAQREAQELRVSAERYADQVLSQLEGDVNRALQIVRNGRLFIQSKRRQG